MKVIVWWKLLCDESYLVMKVKEVGIAKEVKRSDGLWRFACGDVLSLQVLRKQERLSKKRNYWAAIASVAWVNLLSVKPNKQGVTTQIANEHILQGAFPRSAPWLHELVSLILDSITLWHSPIFGTK